MKVTINSVHFKADKKLEDFITQKVEKICAKLPDIIGSEVTLKVENTDSPENKIVDIELKQVSIEANLKHMQNTLNVILGALVSGVGSIIVILLTRGIK